MRRLSRTATEQWKRGSSMLATCQSLALQGRVHILFRLTWCHTGLVPAGPGVKHSTERSLEVPSYPPRTYTLSSYTMDLHHAK